ncbi:hypothetical protein [Variovorax sp. Root318D1]|uniref:hypothetical protein n=1 Tax=Variovorax sp. Root318D1 TaxID=1736513 RepID=UPI001F246204|nr:hypothetical protein [Variovorax sp. Root318D1]
MTCFPLSEEAWTAPGFGAAVEAADAAVDKQVPARVPAATEAPPTSRLRRVGVAVRFLLFADMVRSFFDVVVNAG